MAQRERATPFDVPGVELTHDGPLCSFGAILKKYKLKDPALGKQSGQQTLDQELDLHILERHRARRGSAAKPHQEYYDTLAGGPCNTRFDLNPATSTVYDGTTIMHCHILDHEDQGAMGWADVVGGLAPPLFPDPAFQELYQCGPTGCIPTQSPETSCADGLDNDCDTLLDCDDPDCTANPVCAAPACDTDTVCEPGEDCLNCPNDCSGVTGGKPANRYCCGNGVLEGSEGNGTICDGNP